MNSIKFLNLEKGEIGKLSYYKKQKITTSDNQKTNQISDLTNSYLSMLIAKKSFGEDVDLNNAFQYSRNKAKQHFDNNEYKTIIVHIHYQIKNKNSYNELIEIENKESFISWLDEDLINRIKNNHNE